MRLWGCGISFCALMLSACDLFGGVLLEPGRIEVVVPRGAPKVTRFAASELTNFLSQTLECEVPLVETFTDRKTAFVLGTNKWSEAAGVRPQELPRDGYRIRTAPGRIYIAGCDDPVKDGFFVARHGGMNDQFHEHGTLFGVYEFLERFAGVRFYFPGELGTIVPSKDRIEVPDTDISDAPAYRSARHYQVYWDGKYFEGPDPKVTVNPAKTIQYYRNRMQTQSIPCCHGSNVFRYLDRFGETHPEYFAILPNGERSVRGAKYPCHPGQLCWTSGIVEEMYQDIRSYLIGEPPTVRKILSWTRKGYGWSGNCMGGKYVDVMPQDGFVGCRCERCQAAFSKTDKVHYATELIWGNTVSFAKRLKEENIPGYVVMMAYRPYRRVPDFDIPDNVLVQVAETGPWSLARPADLEKENAEIRAWTKKLGRKVWLWNYVCKVAKLNLPGIPCPAPNAWGEYYSSLEQWIDGAFAETTKCDRWFYNYLNYYIFGKVCWNPKVDWKALLEEHYRLMFGPAAAEMRELYEMLERKWTREIAGKSVDTPLGPVGVPPSVRDIWTRVYSREVLAGMSARLDSARAKVAPGSLEDRRIALVRREFLDPLVAESDRYMEHVKKIASLRHETSKGPLELKVRLGGKEPTVKTAVTVERTDETFSVVFDCEEPLMDQVKCTHTKDGDPMLWEDNDVEVTLNPSGDGQTMFHVVLSSDNVLAVERHQIGSGIPQDWSSLCGVKSSVERTERGWRGRIDIPVKELAGIRREFPANFCRSRVLKDNSTEYIHWSPFATGFQDYENFGRIDLGERFK